MANIINGTDTGSGGLITTGDSSDELQLQTAETARVTLTNTAVVVNEGGNDVDFRVEGDTDANLLFVDASADAVLIGTNTTTNNLRLNERLAVVNVGTFGGASLTGYNGASALPVILDFNKSRGSSDGSMTVVAVNDELGGFVFRGADGTQFQDAAVIVGQVDGTPGAGDMPGRLVFKTTPDGSATPTERMRIDSSGNLLFNSGYGSVATAYGCRAWVNFNGTGTVAIRASGNVSSITDQGQGYYQINFTTSMPDANYATSLGSQDAYPDIGMAPALDTITTSSFRIVNVNATTQSYFDSATVCASVFR